MSNDKQIDQLDLFIEGIKNPIEELINEIKENYNIPVLSETEHVDTDDIIPYEDIYLHEQGGDSNFNKLVDEVGREIVHRGRLLSGIIEGSCNAKGDISRLEKYIVKIDEYYSLLYHVTALDYRSRRYFPFLYVNLNKFTDFFVFGNRMYNYLSNLSRFMQYLQASYAFYLSDIETQVRYLDKVLERRSKSLRDKTFREKVKVEFFKLAKK